MRPPRCARTQASFDINQKRDKQVLKTIEKHSPSKATFNLQQHLLGGVRSLSLFILVLQSYLSGDSNR